MMGRRGIGMCWSTMLKFIRCIMYYRLYSERIFFRLSIWCRYPYLTQLIIYTIQQSTNPRIETYQHETSRSGLDSDHIPSIYKYRHLPHITFTSCTRQKQTYRSKGKMPSLKSILLTLAASALTTATLDPATSNTKGKCPSSINCSGTQTT